MAEGLERFLEAQKDSYQVALQEIRLGRKVSHWMWYIFPQIAGLGHSFTAQYYAIKNLEEAKQYVNHPVLGRNLEEIASALLEIESSDARAVMGRPDDLKLRSSMTLFVIAKPACEVFQMVLDKYFKGEKDKRTIDILERQQSDS